MDIQANDDVVFKIKCAAAIEVFETDDVELDNPVEERYEEGELIEVTILEVDENKFDVQFGDGSIAFIRKGLVEAVSVNE